MKIQVLPTFSEPWKIKRPILFFGLFSLILLCFVLTPLWNSLPGFSLKIMVLLLTLIFAYVFAWFGSSDVTLFNLSQLKSGLFIFVLMTLFNGRALLLSITWKGDEDFHFLFAKQLFEIVCTHKFYGIITFFFFFFFLVQKKLNKFTLLVSLVLAILAAWAGHHAHLDIYNILRYPITIKYFTAGLVYLYSFLPANNYPELPYRMIPFVSSTITIWLAWKVLKTSRAFPRIFMICFLITIPILRYYCTLFYLEMPAVLCMTLVLIRAPLLLEKSLSEIIQDASWYALIFLGFIKETVLPFLLVFMACRFIFYTISLFKLKFCINDWLREALFYLMVGTPLFLYLCYRMGMGNARSYQPSFQNLLDLTLVKILLQSWWESFGILFPLAMAGLVLLLIRKQWPQLVLFFTTLIAFTLFHFIDGNLYIGYSRFNLFLLPVFLLAGLEFMVFVAAINPKIILVITTIGLTVNYFLTPLNWDGTRKPHWGIYLSDVGENDYPYKEALMEIKKLHFGNQVRLVGNPYPYLLNFYLEPKEMLTMSLDSLSLNRQNQNREAQFLDSLLNDSEMKGFKAVLFHLFTDSLLANYNDHVYKHHQVFSNQAHSLVLFTHSLKKM